MKKEEVSILINRKEEIKKKGFSMNFSDSTEDYSESPFVPTDFSKIRVGARPLDDAVLKLGDLSKINPRLTSKSAILQAIENGDLETMREVSNFFYKTSGIYSRLCRYLAFLYRYDWMVVPYVHDESWSQDKLLLNFHKVLTYLDNFGIKKFFGDVALKVLRNGCYYGYIIRQAADRASVQELPPRYCRSRFNVNGMPVVEFNMKYFDDAFKDASQKMKILNLFPNEFKKGYILFKEGKLTPEYPGDTAGWYLLDPDNTIKFNSNGEDFPALISVIPSIIDLDAAQELDRKKMAQKLLKVIIQKLPLDKNNELVFDMDEAAELHNNVVKMLGKAIGVDVLTTFAEVDVADMADKSTTTTVDELAKVERAVYNESGSAQNLFNTDGNLALEKSILNDEAAMYSLLLQFEQFLNKLLDPLNMNPKKVQFRVQMLTTTIYNYKELAKTYKEQTQMGYSKMLPQIALGHSQSSILATAHFENDVLDLVNIFIPPIASNSMSPEMLQKDGDKGGREEKPNDQKSEKTIANRESMN